MLAQTNVWDFVNAQANASKIKRVNWKELLGMTLTEYITHLKDSYGLNTEQTINHIIGYLQKNNMASADNVRRVKISIYARFGEQKSYKKRSEVIK